MGAVRAAKHWAEPSFCEDGRGGSRCKTLGLRPRFARMGRGGLRVKMGECCMGAVRAAKHWAAPSFCEDGRGRLFSGFVHIEKRLTICTNINVIVCFITSGDFLYLSSQ